MQHPKIPILTWFAVTLMALFTQSTIAFAAIVNVVETGGDNDPTDTIAAKWTGQTFPVSIANEPVPGLVVGNSYTVGAFGDLAPCFVDRAHRYSGYTNTAPVPIPAYLVGREYIMSGNDNRDNAGYRLDVTVDQAVRVFMLIDNRLQDGDASTPPTFGPTAMQWIVDQGWAPVKTGVNMAGDPNLPDQVGIDEGADGTINQYYSVYSRTFPAGTFSIFQADNAGRNMYGVVVGTDLVSIATTQIGGGALGSITPNAEPGSFTVVGGGNDIWDASDEFTFHYIPVTGDFDVRAKVESLEAAARWTKAGLMVRETVNGDSRMAYSKVSPIVAPTGGCGDGAADVSFMYRTWLLNVGGPNGGQHEDRIVSDPGYPNYSWVRLQRTGNALKGYASTDGVTWAGPVSQDTANWVSPVGGAPTPFARSALLGFAVSRHGCASQPTAIAEFRGVAIQPPVILAQPASVTAPVGAKAAFKVVADGSFTSVQWKKNGAEISGAKSTIYTTPALTAGDSGASYEVVLLNELTGASATSAAATLTVAGSFAPAPTHRWNFNADANDAVGGANGTLVGGAAVSGGAVALSGSQQYVNLPNGLWDTYGSATFEAWATEAGSGAWARLWDFGNTGLGEDPLQSGPGYGGANYLFFAWPIGDGNGVRGAYKLATTGEQIVGDLRPRPSQNVKHHIVWTQDAVTETAKIYIDGVLVGQNGGFTFKPSDCVPYLNNWLGRSMYQGDAYFKGSIDEFRAFNSAVPAEYVAASIALGPDTLVTPGPVTILQQPTSLTRNETEVATFKVVLNGTLPYAVQWLRNGVAIPGATGTVLSFVAVGADNGATYSAQVSNPEGNATSAGATLTVIGDTTPPTLVSATADDLRRIRVVFSEPVNASQAGDAANYQLSGGSQIATATVQNPTTVLLEIAGSDPALLDGTAYTLTVNDVSDLASTPNPIAPNSTITFRTQAFSRGFVKREIWRDIGGTSVPELTNNAAYRQPAPLFGYYNLLEGPLDPMDNMGIRISGYILPGVSGDYNFYSSSDDQSAFWLSTDESPANLTYLCGQPAWNGFRDYGDAQGNFNGTTTPVPLVAGASYPFLSFMKEGGGGENLSVAWQVPGGTVPPDGSEPIGNGYIATFVDGSESANVRFDIWYGIGGTLVSDLTGNSRYPNNPSETWFGRGAYGVFDSTAVLPLQNKDNYGARISGWFVPPANGNYQFYARSDDQAIIYLSPNADPAGKQQILVNGCCNGSFQAGRRSAAIALVAGNRYYLELLYKEGGGGDYGGVGVALEGAAVPTSSIGGANLAPFQPYAPANLPTITITQQPQSVTRFINRLATFTVGAANSQNVPMTYQWRKNGVSIPGAASPSYTTPPVLAGDDGAKFDCIVAVLGQNAYSAQATLTVPPDPVPPILLSAVGAVGDRIILRFDEAVDPGTASDTANYLINPGAISAVEALVNGMMVVLRTDAQTPGQLYDIVVENITDTTGLAIGANNTAQFTALASLPGVVLRQQWFNLPGGNVITTLTGNPKYPASPDATDLLTTTFSPQSAPDIGNYGARLRAYVIPSETGIYRFEHYSDDAGITYLSLDENPANKQILVNETGCCARRASPQVFLTAGMVYYLEGIFQEGGGGDYLQIQWFPPSSATAAIPIPSENLAVGFNPALIAISQQPADVTTLEKRAVSFAVTAANPEVAPLSYQWQRAEPADPDTFADIAGATARTYTTPRLEVADSGAKYRVLIFAGGIPVVLSAAATATVTPDGAPPTLVSATGSDSFTKITVRFSEVVDSTTANDTANYTVDGGLTIAGVALNADEQSVTITTDAQIPGTVYTVSVFNVADLAGNTIADSTISFTAFVFTPGLVRFDYFNNLSTADNSLDNTLLADPRYPNNPTATYYMTTFNSRNVFPNDSVEGYGARITGVYVPPVSGNYLFYMWSDDSSRLFLNPAGVDPAGKVKIAEETGCCGPWTKVVSPPQALVAGNQYYIEAVYKEGTGGDYIYVGATLEGAPAPVDPTTQSIPGSQLGGFFDPTGTSLNFTQQPQNQLFLISPPTTDGGGGVGGQPLATFTVAATGSLPGQPNATVLYQWQKNTGAGYVDIPGAGATSYTLAPTLADNGTKFRVRAAIPGSVQYSAEATLTVAQLNTPPSFTAGPNQEVNEDAGPQTVADWATDILPHSIARVPVVYGSDFSSVPPGAQMWGMADNVTMNDLVQGGALKLTSGINSSFGVFYTPAVSSVIESYTINFKSYVGGGTCCGDPNSGGVNTTADGYSVNVAANLPVPGAYGNPAEEGAGTGLSVCFDTWDNGGGEAPAIDLKWQGVIVASVKTQVARGPDPIRFIDVSVAVDATGLATVSYDGTNVFENVPLTGWAPQGGLRVGFGARTGGANDNHWIDDLLITAFPADASSAELGQTVQFNVSNDSPALFAVQPAIAPNGTLTYTPAADACGQANVTVVAQDDGGTAYGGKDTSAPKTFVLKVNCVPDCPRANNQLVSTVEDTPVAIVLAAVDPDGDPLTYAIVPPMHGTLAGVPPALIYTPAPNYCGPDAFSYLVSNDPADPACPPVGATVSISVACVNDCPVPALNVVPDTGLGSNGTVIVISPNNTGACILLDASKTTDVEGDTLTYAWYIDRDGDGLPDDVDQDGTPDTIGIGSMITNCLDLGEAKVWVVVSDGQCTVQKMVMLDVITAGDAVDYLIGLVENSDIARKNKRPFLATLKAVMASFDRESFVSGLNQLEAFINKTQAQVAKTDPMEAAEWIRVAQAIIGSFEGTDAITPRNE